MNRDEAEGIGVVVASVLSLAAQPVFANAKFEIVDLTIADSNWADTSTWISEALTGERCDVHGRKDIPQVLHRLSEELGRRQELAKPPGSIFLVILGLQRARSLRLEEADIDRDFGNAAESFARLLKYGSEVGMHVIAWADGMTGLERSIDNSLLREFGLRCAGPLDARGSDILFDCDAAARLGDRPHRMVMTDEKRIGVIHVFRPYELPSQQWISHYGQVLTRRAAEAKEVRQ